MKSPIFHATAGTFVLSLLASCSHAQPATKTIMLDANAPAIKTEVVSTPVRSARSWATAIAPNARGGWNFITQLYEYQYGHTGEAPTEYVVLDLKTGKYTITEKTAGQYTNANYAYGNQLRAKNGRIFFTELNNVIRYYDPVDEKIKDVGQVIDPKDGDKFVYRLEFGPDGKIYGSTQANKLPTVVQIDPDTLQYKVLGHVGKDRLSYSYGYYLAADPTPSPGAPQGWVYVAVGQTPWELAALNIATGEQKILATRADDSWMAFDLKPEGILVKLITGLHRPDVKYDLFWCADGQLYPFPADYKYDPANLPFKPRDVRPLDGSLPAAQLPELDLTDLNADSNGVGHVRWRPAGSKDDKDWKDLAFKVNHTSPVDLESLIALPDGTLLGNAKQYHGFFRYNPKDRSTQFFGAHGPSRGPRALMDGKVYITGYPLSVLYVYDPTKPWTSTNHTTGDDRLKVNPTWLGNFTDAETHYAYYLMPAKNGRLYFGGRRERTGIGGGVGWYEPATKKFGGHHKNLSTLTPRGMALLEDAGRVVYSGEIQNDPALPDQKPTEAQLVLYDLDLNEVERQTVKPGLKSTGELFNAADKNQVIGVIPEDNIIYRYDIVAKKLLDWISVPGKFGASVVKPSDGSIWLMVDDTLTRIDPATMKITTIGKLSGVERGVDLMAWQGNDLYLTSHENLMKVALPHR